MRSFIPLLSYGYALVGVAAVVLLIRVAWRRTSWEQLMQKVKGHSQRRSAGTPAQKDRSRDLRRLRDRYGRGLRGPADPLPDRLRALRSAPLAPLVRHATARRIRSVDPEEPEGILEARIPKDDEAKDADASKESSGPSEETQTREPATVDGFPEAWVRNVAALGPRRPIWGDIMLGIQVGGALSAGLVVLYITQYPFGSVTTSDPYFLQRLALNVAAFMGSWVIIGLIFGLMYEHLRGDPGLRKGLWLGAMILALTLPFQC